MPLENFSSYIPCTNDFIAHWSDVDLTLGASGPVILAGEPGVIPAGFNCSGLVVLRDLLQTQLDTVQSKLNGAQISSTAIENLKVRLLRRLNLFLEFLDGYYRHTDFYGARPDAPGIGAGEGRFFDPMRDAKDLWATINAAPPSGVPSGITLPLRLNEGTPQEPLFVTLADFNTMMALLRTKYEGRSTALQGLVMARGRRNKTMVDIRAVLVAYRTAVLPKIAGDTALLASLPRVTPEPGHTPEAVQISSTFQAPDTARTSHTESEDAKFKAYHYLAAAGEDATLEDAVRLATHTERVPVEFSTQFGLSEPGSAVSLWVSIETTEGNSSTSERNVIHRPLEA